MNYDCKRLFIGRPDMTVLHLSDPHLFAEQDGSLLGVNTQESFCAVLEDIQANGIQPDIIIATGDISQDYSVDSYHFFAEQIAQFAKPVFTLPGNHDEVAKVNSYLSKPPLFLQKQIMTDHWQILMLNSQVKGKVYGEISEQELQWLESVLQANQDIPTMLFTHHHPVPVGCDWLDEIGIHNSDTLLELIGQHKQVKLCGFGHVHQFSELQIQQTLFCSVPSTCVQFKTNSQDFAASSEQPGYAVYQCRANGSVERLSYRVSDYSPTVNFAISGY